MTQKRFFTVDSKHSYLSLWTILLTALGVLFAEPIFHILLNMSWVKAVSASFTPTLITDFCALIAFVVGSLLIDRLSYHASEHVLKSVVASSIIFLSFSIFIRLTHEADLVGLTIASPFKYVDLTIFATVLLLLDSIFRLERKTQEVFNTGENRKPSLLFDDVTAPDILGRNASVQRYAKELIENKNDKGAFGVAVIGGWGTGKSWFMGTLKKELESKGERCLIFKPWLYDQEELTWIFCDQLYKVLKNEGVKSDKLNVLAKDLLKNTGGVGKFFSYLLGLQPFRSRAELISQVKEELSEFPKQIYVFMDECDRLTDKELLEVFSLVRNLCDFSQVCYILSYDESVVDKTLQGYGGLKYAEKMINLPISLEPISNDVIIDGLLKVFDDKIYDIGDTKNRLRRLDIVSYLPTLRDFKRFWNVLYSDYKKQQDIFERALLSEVDWIVLILIKYVDYDIYTIIRDSPSNILKENTESWISPSWYYSCQKLRKDGQIKCESLLTFLFEEERKPHNGVSFFGIANKYWKPIYFSDFLPNDFRDKNEYYHSMDKGTFCDDIEKWTREHDRGLIYIIGAASFHKKVDAIQTIKCLLDYIWTKNDIDLNVVPYELLRIGYTNQNYPHSFPQINSMIQEEVMLVQISGQAILDFVTEILTLDRDLQNLCKESSHPLEIMCLFMNLQKEKKIVDENVIKVVANCIPNLWHRILEDDRKEYIDTLNILEILYDMNLEDPFHNISYQLIKTDFKRWLGATLEVVHEDKSNYLILNAHKTYALFRDIKNVASCLHSLEESMHFEDIGFIKEYLTLFTTINDYIHQEDDFQDQNEENKYENLKLWHFPTLSKVKFNGIEGRTINEAFSEFSVRPQWRTKNHTGIVK